MSTAIPSSLSAASPFSQVLIEVLLPPFDHITLVCKEIAAQVPAHIGLRHVAFAGTVQLLVEFPSVVCLVQLFHRFAISVLLLALLPSEDRVLSVPCPSVSLHVPSRAVLQHSRPCCILLLD